MRLIPHLPDTVPLFRSVGIGLSAVVALSSASELSGQEAKPFGPMDVFQLEFAADPRISPDGSSVVYTRTSMDVMQDRQRRELWLLSLDDGTHRPLGPGSSPRWSPGGERVAFLRDGQIHVRWMDSGQTAAITRLERAPRGISWSPDGSRIAFNMLVADPIPHLAEPLRPPEGAQWADPPVLENRFKNRQDGAGYLPFGYEHVFVVAADGGTPIQITQGDFRHASRAVWSPDSQQLYFSSNRSPEWAREHRNSEIYSVSAEGGPIRPLTRRNGPDHSPAVSPDGTLIAYAGFDDRLRTYQVTRIHVMAADGSGARSLTDGLDRSASSPWWDPSGDGVFFLYDDEGNTKLGRVSLNGQIQELAGDIGGTSYGRPYGGGSFSVSASGRYAVNQTRPGMPGEVAVGEAEGTPSRLVTEINRDLMDARVLGEVEELWWTSSVDGRRIQGWIVKPPGFDPSLKYPLILEIHGGPISNYGDRFSAEMQLLAAAGFVVLYANPRGSTSYGEEFGDLLYHDYPGDDYKDLMDGVDAVIARGSIDEENLFVTGGSAGGIMTAWIVGKTDRFRAAAAQKPVVNWISKVLTADNWYGYFHSRYEGLPWEDPTNYWKFSPLSLVGNVETPTLLITGEEDLRTPLSESYQLFHALKMRGVETAVVRLPGASHDMSRRPSQLVAKIRNILAWFDRHRSPRPTA